MRWKSRKWHHETRHEQDHRSQVLASTMSRMYDTINQTSQRKQGPPTSCNLVPRKKNCHGCSYIVMRLSQGWVSLRFTYHFLVLSLEDVSSSRVI